MLKRNRKRKDKDTREKFKKLLLISHEYGETSVAVVERNVLQEFYVERKTAEKIYGNIYKGIVKAIVPGINAVFVDIGTGKDGFLYLHDASRPETEEDRDDFFFDYDDSKSTAAAPPVKEGDEIIVQVAKEAIRSKGPRLTTKLSIPARYMVLTSETGQHGISRRINDKAERERIRSILEEMQMPKDVGFIVRTVAEGKSKHELQRDVKYLMKVWHAIRQKRQSVKAPGLIHAELDLVERVIRDTFTEDTSQIIADSPEMHKKILHFFKIYIPRYKPTIHLYKEKMPLFVKHHVAKDIESTYTRKVHLKCGGTIVIEQTEGLIAIDVNSGRYKDKQGAEETAFRTNIEAAREAVRQLRLRDLGGIIVIDFIDMYTAAHKRELMRILNEEVVRDKAKINILKISEIGVVEMTRQRLRASKESSVFENCPYCFGRGVVKSRATMRIQVLKELRQKASTLRNKHVLVAVHPDIAEDLMQFNQGQIAEIERMNKNTVVVTADPSYHQEEVSITY